MFVACHAIVTELEPLTSLNLILNGTESPSRKLELFALRSPFCQSPPPPLPGQLAELPKEPLAH